MNILLISPLLTRRNPYVPNIGLAYIGAVLIENGHSVSMLDIEAFKYSKETVRGKIREENMDIICIGTLVTGFAYVSWLCGMIKEIKPEVPIILGNSIATTIPEIALRHLDVDYLVLGEGEITIIELINAIKHNTPKSTIHGIAYLDNNEVIITKERELIKDLDTIPFPAWHLVPLKEVYFKNRSKGSIITPPIGFVSVIRGCPFKCTFCYHPYQNKKIRMHSARRIVDEIKFLIKNYGIKSLGFSADLFFINKRKVFEILDLMDEEKIRINWRAAARVSTIDEELMKRIKASGCVELGIGVESGSQKILDNIKKQTTVEEAEKALSLCKKYKINPLTSYMIGNVGETRETVFETIAFRKKYDPGMGGFFYATPYPDTELYRYALAKNLIKDEVALMNMYGEQSDNILVNFTDMTDQELMDLKQEANKILILDYLKKKPLKAFFHIEKAILNKVANKLTAESDY